MFWICRKAEDKLNQAKLAGQGRIEEAEKARDAASAEARRYKDASAAAEAKAKEIDDMRRAQEAAGMKASEIETRAKSEVCLRPSGLSAAVHSVSQTFRSFGSSAQCG